MKAWGDAQGATGKIRMLADTCGEFVKAADLELDLAAVLGNVRCGRGGGVSRVHVDWMVNGKMA